MPNFLVNFFRAGNGMGYLAARHRAKPLSQLVQRHLDGAFAHGQFRGAPGKSTSGIDSRQGFILGTAGSSERSQPNLLLDNAGSRWQVAGEFAGKCSTFSAWSRQTIRLASPKREATRNFQLLLVLTD